MLNGNHDLISGNHIRGLYVADRDKKDYLENWNGFDLTKCKYLLDKTIINPFYYDYHILNWQNYGHKMIYMIRNIYDVLKTHFIVNLSGKEIIYDDLDTEMKWNIETIDDLTEKDIIELMNYNKFKHTHYECIINLPEDVFKIDKNILFISFEDVNNNTESSLQKVEEFIGTTLINRELPHHNKEETWYVDTKEYKKVLKAFEKWKDFIYDIFVDYEEWYKLSELTKINFIDKYNILG